MLVEDEEAIANLTEKTLSNLGYEVAFTARSGEDAIRTSREDKPDLVLMDIGLKGAMDGIEAAKEIRLNLDIPVVFLTAAEDDKTLARAKTAEPFGYIVKPFRPRDLRATIEIALSQHQANRRRADRTLQEAERRFRSQFYDAVAGMFQARVDGQFLQANQALVRMLGYESVEDLLAAAKNVVQVLKVDLNPGQELAPVCQNPSGTKNFELQAYRKDGSTIWVSGRVRAVRDSRGNVLCYEGNVMDMGTPGY